MLTAKDRSEIKQRIVEAIREEWAQKSANSLPAVDITARATEVFGSADKAIRWLQSPVRALDGKTPLSLLDTEEGIVRVKDVLGRVEHGVW